MEYTLFYNFILMFFVSCSKLLHANRGAFGCIYSYEKRELHVNCSHMLFLYNIPQVPSNTFSLNLQHNMIFGIGNNEFINMTNLRVLDLSYTILHYISEGAFNGLENTFSLNLQHNSISSIKNNQFKNMRNLTVLDLSFNSLQYISEGAFNGLEKLQQLRLNNNNLYYLLTNISFQPLKSLKLLSIESNEAYKFSGPQRSHFPAKTIACLTKLEILKMDLYKVSYDVPMSPIFGKEYYKLPHLYSIYLNGAGLRSVKLTMTFFQYTPNLTHLYIFHVPKVIFHNLILSTLNKLKLLQIDYSPAYSKGINGNKEQLFRFFDLISELSHSPPEILIIQNLLSDDYNYGTFVHCFMKEFNEFFNTIRQLHLTNIFGLNQMCIATQSVFNVPPSLQILNLKMNNLTWIALNLSYVVSLDLKHNRLGNYLVNNNYMITQSSKLEDISLSHNQIYKLNTEIFIDQPYLKHIDLSFNNISYISFDLCHLEKLQILNLANNEIKFKKKKSMKEIDRLLQKNNDTNIDLSNNPFQCTCNTFSFLKWMRQIRHHFIRFSKYQCISGNVPITKNNSFDQVILNLEQDCLKLKLKIKNSATLVVSLTVFGVIAAMILFSAVIIYKQRWKLCYMYYTAKMKYNTNKSNKEDASEYLYDAFISYSDEDRMFVIDHCIKKLEQDRNLKLCIHERDFIPGHDINNNMVTAIQTSRKTICIITRSYLKSDFCMFELNMAKMESTHSRNGKNILVLVFNEKLSTKDLPLLLYEHIQKQSYIQYPNNEIGNAIFWGKISDAIYA